MKDLQFGVQQLYSFPKANVIVVKVTQATEGEY